MPDVEDVMESDVGLIFFIWMLMSTMIGMVSYKSRAHDIFSMYQEESVDQWSLPILMGFRCCQYS
jgi:hypothetical protein